MRFHHVLPIVSLVCGVPLAAFAQQAPRTTPAADKSVATESNASATPAAPTAATLATPKTATPTVSPFYRVAHITVDQTGKNPSIAREMALEEGQKKAWDILIHRLTNLEEAPALDDARLAKLFHGVEVQNEKTSPTRYVGNLTFTFNAHAKHHRPVMSGI